MVKKYYLGIPFEPNIKNIAIFITSIILLSLFLLFYKFSHSPTYKSTENFDNPSNTWSPQLVQKFIKFQKVLNPQTTYDMNIVQKQATPQEVEYLFQNNQWPWSEEVKELYQSAVAQNLYISVDPNLAVSDAQSVYNQNAIMQLLSFRTKEGQFLLKGVLLGHTKNMPDNINNIAVCGIDSKGNSILNKVLYTGYNGFDGHMIENITPIQNKDIPSLVNGFTFLNGQCNPCSALNNPPEYSCPFSLNVGDGNEVSNVWQMLWGTHPSPSFYSTKIQQPTEPDTSSKIEFNYSDSNSISSFPAPATPELAPSLPSFSSSSPVVSDPSIAFA